MISTFLRPTRSAQTPKIAAPTGRISSVTVVRNAIRVSETPKSVADLDVDEHDDEVVEGVHRPAERRGGDARGMSAPVIRSAVLRGRRSSRPPRQRAAMPPSDALCPIRPAAITPAWQTGRVSLAVRVIPCLDVDAGRVVKGVNFAGLRDAGDPVELARRYDEQGADELTFLDITRVLGRSRDDLRRRAPHRRAGVHPADRRRRRAHRWPTSTRCCGPAPTRSA